MLWPGPLPNFLQLLKWCSPQKIDIHWIARSDKKNSDYLNGVVDFDRWIVKDSYFQVVAAVWGPFTVDDSANFVNAKVPKFYSLFFQPVKLAFTL